MSDIRITLLEVGMKTIYWLIFTIFLILATLIASIYIFDDEEDVMKETPPTYLVQ